MDRSTILRRIVPGRIRSVRSAGLVDPEPFSEDSFAVGDEDVCAARGHRLQDAAVPFAPVQAVSSERGVLLSRPDSARTMR